MDPHHLDVENLDFGIDACNEFNPFEDDKISTYSSVSPSNLPQPNPICRRPRASRRTSILWNHFTIINRQNTRGEVENLAECKYCKKHIVAKLVVAQVTLKDMSNNVQKKHGALDPRQFQISQNEIGSSTSSMTPFITINNS